MRMVDPEADEALLLALLNSAPVVDGVPTDELSTEDKARSWLDLHAPSLAPMSAQSLREARTALQAVIRAQESATVLTPLLDGVSWHPSTTPDGINWHIEGDSVTTRAVLAWGSLRTSAPGRLRPCANTDCALFLLDRSKPNNARWCSMATCGNRMKARRHYQRTRTHTSDKTE